MGVGSLSSPCVFQGSNLGSQALGQVPLPAESFLWPPKQGLFCFMCILFTCMSITQACLLSRKVRKRVLYSRLELHMDESLQIGAQKPKYSARVPSALNTEPFL